MKKRIKITLTALFLYMSFFFLIVQKWVPDNFGDQISFSQILFLLKSPMEGTDQTLVFSFIGQCLVIPFTLSFLCCFFIFRKYNFRLLISMRIKNKKKKAKTISFFGILKKYGIYASALLSIIAFCFAAKQLGLDIYINNLRSSSTIFEKYYVNPKSQDYQFPEQKRNLIYIYLESMETTYLSKDLGGAMDYNLIPGLSVLSEENISFTDVAKHGFYVPEGTGWTVAGLVAQSSGLNLNIPIDGNSYGNDDTPFLPGAYTIGDILENAGYNQSLVIGSEAEFGGRKSYFTQHGNYDILDYKYAIDHGLIESDYKVWWGYEDKRLFEFAKSELINLSSQNAPFNLTMLTADTHFTGGYLDETCPTPYDDQLSNVLTCSSNQVLDFVRWIQEQPFYSNTTIVIAGDHLSMEPEWFNQLDDRYQRRGYNVFINSAVTPVQKKNERTFTSLDMFPSTISSLGITYSGNRLGLGTDLFSKKQTLAEELGLKKLNNELARYSKYYNKNILE